MVQNLKAEDLKPEYERLVALEHEGWYICSHILFSNHHLIRFINGGGDWHYAGYTVPSDQAALLDEYQAFKIEFNEATQRRFNSLYSFFHYALNAKEMIHEDNLVEYLKEYAYSTFVNRTEWLGSVNWQKATRCYKINMHRFEWEGQTYYF